MVVHLLRGKDITVNGARVGRLPRRYGAPKANTDAKEPALLALDSAGLFVVVSAPSLGLSVMWDGGTRVYVRVSPKNRGNVLGLCGNYNSRIDDDYATQQGSLEASVSLFADSWRLAQSCPESQDANAKGLINPCKANPHREGWARRTCSVISSGSLFAACRVVVGHSTYNEWCVRDSCACDSGGDCECLCTAIAAFAAECNRRGVHVRWRSQELCPMQCDDGMEYRPCGPVCQPSCRTIGSEPEMHCTAIPCVEGCFCPSGTVFHGGSCVADVECPCPLSGGEFPPGTSLHDDCRECTCVAGRWECEGKSCSESRTCTSDHFQCSDGRCVPSAWRCDSERDCRDASDEENCKEASPACGDNEYRCGTGDCIVITFRCDGAEDCADGADEYECEDYNFTRCTGHEFACDNGRCVPNSFVCDGKYDCGFGDNSDESGCLQSCVAAAFFRCESSECLPRFRLCDGALDCADSSDEMNCACASSHYTCAGETCIGRDLVCDGREDCLQGEDEHSCRNVTIPTKAPQFSTAVPFPERSDIPSIEGKCDGGYIPCAGSGLCIPEDAQCDGLPDCLDGADELECYYGTAAPVIKPNATDCPDFFCENDTSACLKWDEVCDGTQHCADRSDEPPYCWHGCAEDGFRCDKGAKCLQKHLVCDKQLHCKDGTDEGREACESILMEGCYSGFLCDDQICMNGSMVCDGVPDCSHGEDEQGCPPAATQPPITQPYTDNAPTVTVASKLDAALTTRDGETSTTSPRQRSCPEFSCVNGLCIDLNRICNRVDDCQDGAGIQHSERPDSRFHLQISSDEAGCALWATWFPWGSCSVSCGSGVQMRNRRCAPGVPRNKKATASQDDPLRSECRGNTKNTRPCFVLPCDGDRPELKPWMDWSSCSATCGGGVSLRYRQCINSSECATSDKSPPQIRTCGEEKCPGAECPGTKMYKSCPDVVANAKKKTCQLTCRSLSPDGGVDLCEANVNGCIPGCHCPDGLLLWNDTASECVPKDKCPCHYKHKVFAPGQSIEDVGSCQMCTCVGGGLVENCRPISNCHAGTTPEPPTTSSTAPDVCGWSQWSDWGPCFGPCGVNGVQWSFRSPSAPSRYGVARRCAGERRKSRRCPTKRCEVCKIKEPGFPITTKTVGEKWKKAPCSICTCNSDIEIECKKFCEFAIVGCPDNDTLIFPTDVEDDNSCCFCQSEYVVGAKDTTPAPTVVFLTQHLELEMTSVLPPVTYTGYKYATTDMTCRTNQFRCVVNGKCLTKSLVCDGVPHCSDESDELNCQTGIGDDGCSYRTWSQWSECSETCGVGMQKKHRGLLNSGENEHNCSGPFQTIRPCFSAACRLDGAWGAWQHWTNCSRTCGGGVRFRIRPCDNPLPINGGEECPGENMESQLCNEVPCSQAICTGGRIYVNTSSCEDFSACSQTCADLSSGVNCKTECKVGCFCPPEQFFQDDVCVWASQCRCSYNGVEYSPWDEFHINGCPCKCSNGVAECAKDNCIVDCGWSDWSTWSSCDRTCGRIGRAYRFRSPTNPPASAVGAKECEGRTTETRRCMSNARRAKASACTPSWSIWLHWTECTESCGLGTQTRIRTCEVDDVKTLDAHCFPGVDKSRSLETRICAGNSTNSTECNLPVDPESHLCPAGASWECQRCPRTCANLADVEIEGQGRELNETRCLEEEDCAWMCVCPEGLFLQNNHCLPLSACDCTLPSTRINSTDKKIQNGTWVAIGCKNCSCDAGRLDCMESIDAQGRSQCPLEGMEITFEWTPWSGWDACSKTCISRSVSGDQFVPVIGTHTRRRQCLPVSKNSAIERACPGPATQTEKCGHTMCPVTKHWGKWEEWSACDRSCGGGAQLRRRVSMRNGVNSPMTESLEPSKQIRACALRPCKESQCPAGSSLTETCTDAQKEENCLRASTCLDLSSELYTDKSRCDATKWNRSSPCQKLAKSCQCNKGLLWQGGSCVAISKCNCYFMGKIRRPNQTFRVGACLSCRCTKGTVECENVNSKDDHSCADEKSACDDATLMTSPWSAWTPCSQTCDVGQRKRLRSKMPHPALSEFFRRRCGDVEFEADDCAIGPCSKWPDSTPHDTPQWTAWGGCSLTCGDGGWRHRYRHCSRNSECADDTTSTEKCDAILPPCSQDGSWGQWSEWTPCSATCLSKACTPFRSRVRKCDDPVPKGEGDYCPGAATDISECDGMPQCENTPALTPDQCERRINGSKYSECGPPCPRTCSDLQYCKYKCIPGCYCTPGFVVNTEQTTCVPKTDCGCHDAGTGESYKSGEKFTTGNICKRDCKCSEGEIVCDTETYGCPVAGSWCQWSHWTACTRSCGTQSRTRVRSCGCPAPSDFDNEQLLCPTPARDHSRNLKEDVAKDGLTHTQTGDCRIFPTCPKPAPVDGWSEWSQWSQCPCDALFSTRNRTCLSHCSGPWLELRPCRFDPLQCGFKCPPGLILAPCGSNPSRPAVASQCPNTCLGSSDGVKCAADIQEKEMLSVPLAEVRRRRWDNCVPQCICPEGHFLDPANTTGTLCLPELECPCYSKDITGVATHNTGGFVNTWKSYSVGVNKTNQVGCKHCSCSHGNRLECVKLNETECIATNASARMPKWSEWSAWSECSMSCDVGTQWRARLCLAQPASDVTAGGSSLPECYGPKDEERACKLNISCKMLSWEAWSLCSATCGSGLRSRARICRNGAHCLPGELKQMGRCLSEPCPPTWSEWSAWSNCGAKCGAGRQSRERICANSTAQFAASVCNGSDDAIIASEDDIVKDKNQSLVADYKPCKAKRPCPPPGSPGFHSTSMFFPSLQWSSWSSWSGCSKSCGGGICKRMRTCEVVVAENQDAYYEDPLSVMNQDVFGDEVDGCRGEYNQSKICNVSPCPVNKRCPGDMAWKTCGELCGTSDRHVNNFTTGGGPVRRPISCDELAEGAGEPCDDPDFCVDACVCEDGGFLQREGKCVQSDECECVDEYGRLWPPRVHWEKTAKNGCRSNCTCSHGRVVCHDIRGDDDSCVRGVVGGDACAWSPWTPWTACNSTCHDGNSNPVRFRFRSHLNMEDLDWVPCDGGTVMETNQCGDLPRCYCFNGRKNGEVWKDGDCTSCQCQPDGQVKCSDICWGPWSPWSTCSVTCGADGVETRRRDCEKPSLCERMLQNTSESRLCSTDITRPCVKCDEDVMRNCPDMTCRDGEVPTTRENECCHVCVSEADGDTEDLLPGIGCILKTEIRNLTIDDCGAKNVRVSYCAGACRSSVHVVALEPYLHTSCECCSHTLDEAKPSMKVSLQCQSGGKRMVHLPRISECRCSTCLASGQARAEP